MRRKIIKFDRLYVTETYIMRLIEVVKGIVVRLVVRVLIILRVCASTVNRSSSINRGASKQGRKQNIFAWECARNL